MEEKAMVFAITGGIGSGKSYVVNMLRESGVQVYDCDSAAQRLMRESAEVKAKLTALIGDGLYTADGLLRKDIMRSFLFASDENREAINGIVHPAVADDFRKSGLSVMECAILFESGFDKLVDKVVCVCAPLELRIQRVMSRDNARREAVLEWMSRQLPQTELQRRSHILIYNDGNHNLKEQVSTLIEKINVKTE